MKQTFIYILTSIALISALERTAAAQQKAISPPQVQPQQRPRGAAAQQPLRDAAKAAKQAAPEPRNLDADQAKKAQQQRNKMANAVVARYLVGFQQQVGLSDEQAQKFGDVLGNYVRRELMLAQVKTDALKRLKELTDRQASQEEIQAQNVMLETTEANQINVKKRFFAQINPELTVQQQGKLKVYLDSTGREISQAIQKSTQ